jgi:exonuclease VII large subunit
MNWGLYLTSIGLVVAIAGFLLKHILDKKAAAIEALVLKNDFLEAQLKDAEKRSPDILLDQLTKRIRSYEEELIRLSKDRDANQSLIEAKEEEIRATKQLQKTLENEIEHHIKEYSRLEDKLNVCPYCEAELIELTYVEAERDSGTLKRYKCGYSEIDGYLRTYCPSDEEFPPMSEFKMWIRKHILYDEWACSLQPVTDRARKVITKEVWGRTEEEAQQNMFKAYDEKFIRDNYNLPNQ